MHLWRCLANMGDLIMGGHLKTCFRNFLCAALYRVLPEGRPEDHHAGGAAAGGQHQLLAIQHQANNASHYPVQLLTKDSVTVSVDAVVYYRVSNAIVSVTNVKDTHHSTK